MAWLLIEWLFCAGCAPRVEVVARYAVLSECEARAERLNDVLNWNFYHGCGAEV